MKRIENSNGHFISVEVSEDNAMFMYAWDEPSGEQCIFGIDQNILFADLLETDLDTLLKRNMFDSDGSYAPEAERDNLKQYIESVIADKRAEVKQDAE